MIFEGIVQWFRDADQAARDRMAEWIMPQLQNEAEHLRLELADEQTPEERKREAAKLLKRAEDLLKEADVLLKEVEEQGYGHDSKKQ